MISAATSSRRRQNRVVARRREQAYRGRTQESDQARSGLRCVGRRSHRIDTPAARAGLRRESRVILASYSPDRAAVRLVPSAALRRRISARSRRTLGRRTGFDLDRFSVPRTRLQPPRSSLALFAFALSARHPDVGMCCSRDLILAPSPFVRDEPVGGIRPSPSRVGHRDLLAARARREAASRVLRTRSRCGGLRLCAVAAAFYGWHRFVRANRARGTLATAIRRHRPPCFPFVFSGAPRIARTGPLAGRWLGLVAATLYSHFSRRRGGPAAVLLSRSPPSFFLTVARVAHWRRLARIRILSAAAVVPALLIPTVALRAIIPTSIRPRGPLSTTRGAAAQARSIRTFRYEWLRLALSPASDWATGRSNTQSMPRETIHR